MGRRSSSQNRATGRRTVGVAIGVAVILGLARVSTTPVHGQQTKEAGQAGAVALDLGTRYRFQQQFAVGSEKAAPHAIIQYRAAFKQTLKVTTDVARAAPKREETVQRAKYEERPAEVSATDQRKITGAIRRYQAVSVSPDPEASPSGPRPFENLMIWIRPRAAELAEVLVLSPDHRLTDREWRFAVRQPFVPDYVFALPDTPVRIGETWKVGRAGASALLGLPAQGQLIGKFLEIRDDPASKRRKAILDIAGQTNTPVGRASVHAQVEFAFVPPVAPPQTTNDAAAELTSAVDLNGEIVRVALADETVNASTTDERLRQMVRHELVLECQSADPGALLELPATPPQATVDNSWLTYTDPKGRFSFQHPQEFMLQFPAPDAIVLARQRPNSEPDLVEVDLMAKGELDPELRKKAYFDEAKGKFETIPGDSGWLPETDWPNMKVFRFEAAVIPPESGAGAAQRQHFFGYVVQTGRPTGLYVESQTPRYPSTLFRQQVESVIKTFKFGPANAAQK